MPDLDLKSILVISLAVVPREFDPRKQDCDPVLISSRSNVESYRGWLNFTCCGGLVGTAL